MRALLVPNPVIRSDIDAIRSRLLSRGVDLVVQPAEALRDGDLGSIEVVAGPGSMICGSAVFARAPKLRGLVSIGSGCEGFDREAAERAGVRIRTGATRQNVTGMASATIMLMLALVHDLPGAQQAVRAGGRRDTSGCRLLDEMTVGIVGYGAIGAEVARRLRAWDIAVIAYSPSRSPGTTDGCARFCDLDDVLRQSDLISLHTALTPATRNLLNADRLARLKSGALVVNTARGGLIDEDALVRSLISGRVAGAALDCFAQEPLPAVSILRDAPNLILTPHQIGHTRDGEASLLSALIDNIASFAVHADGTE